MAKRRNNSMVGNMLSMGVGNLVGVGMIGATSEAVQGLPAGTAKTLAGNIPALQSTALLGANLGMMKGYGSSPRRTRARKRTGKVSTKW